MYVCGIINWYRMYDGGAVIEAHPPEFVGPRQNATSTKHAVHRGGCAAMDVGWMKMMMGSLLVCRCFRTVYPMSE